MEVKMNKEIRDYQESMFFGLNFRQCAFSVLAILAAVAIYFGTKGRLPDDVQGWLCMLGAAPFAACGFFKYHGMTAEQFLRKYDYLFTVEDVNRLVLAGVPFREAYKQVGMAVQRGEYHPTREVHHTHEGSIGNLCTAQIRRKMERVMSEFE